MKSVKHDVSFALNWEHIATALEHELYDKIASTLMVVVNRGYTIFENVNSNELLKEIKNETQIHQKEINYIRQLIVRAKQLSCGMYCSNFVIILLYMIESL
eukprot:843358_1